MYVCNRETNSVEFISKDGCTHQYNTVIGHMDYTLPYSLCYRDTDNTLIVGDCSNTVKLFQYK